MKLPVVWTMAGYVDVDADTLEEAMDKFNREMDHIKLPQDGTYVDGSFALATDDVDEMRTIIEE